MKTITRLSFLLIIVSILFTQCENEEGLQISEIESGKISIEMNLKNMSDEVTQIKGLLYRPGFDTIQIEFNFDEQKATALLEGIPAGTWTVKVDAYNTNGEIIYSGSSQVDVLVGKVTPVYIHLYKTGSIEVIVTWEEEIGLVAYYPFNGNSKDESGNSNHGIVHGAKLTSDRFGNPNSAYDFDGIDDFIFVEDSRSLRSPSSSVTITAWVYIREWDKGWAVVCVKSDNVVDGQYGLQFLEGGLFEFYCSNYNRGVYTSYQFPLKKWWFCSVTYDGSEIKTYADGNLIKTVSFTYPSGTNTSPLIIGKDSPGLVEHHNGKLDEVRIYNRALSESEIMSLFYSGGLVITGDDSFEDNDSQSGAPYLRENTDYQDLIVTKSDDDWYEISTSADSIIITCDFIHVNGDINIELVDKNGTILAFSNSLTDNEKIIYITSVLDTYYIHVYMRAGTSNSYALWWDDIWQGE